MEVIKPKKAWPSTGAGVPVRVGLPKDNKRGAGFARSERGGPGVCAQRGPPGEH